MSIKNYKALKKAVFLLATLVAGNHAWANDDFLGHWRITSTGMSSFPLMPLTYELSIEKQGDGYTGWIYNGPVDVSISGNNIEVVVDWIEGADATHRSKLIGSLNNGEIMGVLDHGNASEFSGASIKNGNFRGVRIDQSKAAGTLEDLPPDPVDLEGLWRSAFDKLPFMKHMFALTDKGQKIRQNFKEMDAPHIRCAGYGLVTASSFAGFLYGIEIFQAEDQITLAYGADYVRRIYMDDREYPDNREDTDMGFSKGEWVGNTLVVKTTHLTPNFIRPGHGHPISGNTYTIEHFSLDDQGYLKADMWIHDPENYDRPPYLERTYDRVFSAEVLTKVGCDAYSYYRQLYMEGELEEFFSRGKYRR